MVLNYAKQALIEFQKEHESYLEKRKSYQEWRNLPFWKKWFTKRIEAPHRDYLYKSLTVYSRRNLTIELRMYYSREDKSITLAINENNCGYKINVATGRISHYLGRVNPNISPKAESLLESIRKELAPLYVE